MAEQGWKVEERRVAMAFSKWLSGGKCERVLARQKMQGRMIERLHGDLAPHPDCPLIWSPAADWFARGFQVDAKRRAAFSVKGLLTQPAHPVYAWWQKLSEQTRSGKWRMLVALEGQTRVLIYGEQEATWLDERHGRKGLPPYLRLSSGREGQERLSLFHLDAWLKAVDPVGLGVPLSVMEVTP